MNHIGRKNNIPAMIVFLMFLIGMNACSDDSENPFEEEGKGIPVELALAIGDKSGTGGIRSHEDPAGEEEIYSLEVFLFSTTGRLDGYKLITPEIKTVTSGAGKYYDKEYKNITEIREIELTAGERHLYVIANPPLTKNGNQYESVLKPKLATGTGSYNSFKALYAELADQGYIASPGEKFPNYDGLPIGGKDPSGLQTALTMVGYETITFSNQHTQHYLGYSGTGKPGGGSIDNSTEKVIRTGTFGVERLVARVGLKKVTFNFPPEGLPLDSDQPGEKVTDFNATITGVFMVNVQSRVRFRDEAGNAPFAGQYVYGLPAGYEFLSNNLGNIAAGLYFDPDEPKSKLEEEIYTRIYDINENSPVWFYAFENQKEDTPTYLAIQVEYNFESIKDAGVYKTATCYYPVIVNHEGITNGEDHHLVKKNYQYWISIEIKGLPATYHMDSAVPIVRSAGESAWNEGMTVEQEIGRNLFPWTGNVYPQ